MVQRSYADKPRRQDNRPKQRNRIPAMSKVRYARMQEYRKKRDVFLKKNPLCARCGKKSIDLHHSKGRIGRLLCADEHWFAVCRTCHNWIGDNPNQAREEGFLCQLGQWNTV